jgi:multicomponent Na+:H+ antiporter subunit E
MLLANILLAVAWAALQGEFSLSNLVVGYLIGYVILAALARGGVLPGAYRKKVRAVFALASFLFWAFIVANIRMARDVLRSQRVLRPGIVRVPLEVHADHEILMLTTLINLTPGTIAVDVSNDRKSLYLHVMHMTDPDAVRAEIKNSFERRVLEILR